MCAVRPYAYSAGQRCAVAPGSQLLAILWSDLTTTQCRIVDRIRNVRLK